MIGTQANKIRCQPINKNVLYNGSRTADGTGHVGRDTPAEIPAVSWIQIVSIAIDVLRLQSVTLTFPSCYDIQTSIEKPLGFQNFTSRHTAFPTVA